MYVEGRCGKERGSARLLSDADPCFSLFTRTVFLTSNGSSLCG